MEAKIVVRAAGCARKLVRRCFVAVLNAIAYAVGEVAVAVFYPPVALAKAIKETEKEGTTWMFRVLFGGALLLAGIGAIVTIVILARQ